MEPMAVSVGFDVLKEDTSFCVMDEAGKILGQGDPAALVASPTEHPQTYRPRKYQ